MKPGHLDVAIKTEMGHTNTIFYWSMNLKMNVDYKTRLIHGQPILDCMVSYLKPIYCHLCKPCTHLCPCVHKCMSLKKGPLGLIFFLHIFGSEMWYKFEIWHKKSPKMHIWLTYDWIFGKRVLTYMGKKVYIFNWCKYTPKVAFDHTYFH